MSSTLGNYEEFEADWESFYQAVSDYAYRCVSGTLAERDYIPPEQGESWAEAHYPDFAASHDMPALLGVAPQQTDVLKEAKERFEYLFCEAWEEARLS